jgi:hypothetical protein
MVNDAHTTSSRHEIALRPAIRYFGLLVPITIGLPHVIALIGLGIATVFASESDADWLKDIGWQGILMSLVFASLGLWTGYRWWRLGASIDEREVIMRGLFRSIGVSSTSFHEVRLQSMRTHSQEHGYSMKQRYALVDAHDRVIAVLPPSVSLCGDFPAFLERLRSRASRNARSTTGPLSRDLSQLPVDEWTLKDMENYERNS